MDLVNKKGVGNLRFSKACCRWYRLRASIKCAFYAITPSLSQRARGMEEIANCDRAQYTYYACDSFHGYQGRQFGLLPRTDCRKPAAHVYFRRGRKK